MPKPKATTTTVDHKWFADWAKVPTKIKHVVFTVRQVASTLGWAILEEGEVTVPRGRITKLGNAIVHSTLGSKTTKYVGGDLEGQVTVQELLTSMLISEIDVVDIERELEAASKARKERSRKLQNLKRRQRRLKSEADSLSERCRSLEVEEGVIGYPIEDLLSLKRMYDSTKAKLHRVVSSRIDLEREIWALETSPL